MSDTHHPPPFPEKWIAKLRTLMGDSPLGETVGDVSARQWAVDNSIDLATQFLALMAVLEIPTVPDLSAWSPAAGIPEKLRYWFFSRSWCPLHAVQGSSFGTAMVCDWSGWDTVDLIRRRLGIDLAVARTDRDVLSRAINDAYQGQDTATQSFIDSLDAGAIHINTADLAESDLLDKYRARSDRPHG